MEVPVEKNKEYIVEIIDNGFEGEGIAKINNFRIFVPNAIKGEKVKVLILKVLSSYAFAKIIEIIEKSEFREETDCISYKRCGGCNLRHVKYEETLKIKQNAVQNLVNKTLRKKYKSRRNSPEWKNLCIIEIRQFTQYGKDKSGKAIFGVFASRSHEIIEFESCKIQTKISQEIAKVIIDFVNENKISVYDEKTGKGSFRHVIIKYGMKTDEVMCVFVLGKEKLEKESEIVSKLLDKFSNIKTIVKNINAKKTNVILGDKNIVLYGDGYIKDKLRRICISNIAYVILSGKSTPNRKVI